MKPHLCHVFPAYATGGPEVRTTVLLNALSEPFRHTVVALNGDLSGRERVHDAVDIDFIAAPPRGRTGFAFTLRPLLQELSPDLLLTYGWGGIDAIAAGRMCGIRRIVHMEDGFLPDEALKQKFKRLLARRVMLRCASWLVCPSQTLVSIARRLWWLPEKSVRFIPNGVDVRRFQPGDRAVARRQLGLPADGLVIGTVGHLRAEKNQERLVQAFARVTGRRDARLLIVGGGPLREHLEQCARELGVADRVYFPGVIQHPVACYQAMDVFALSSDTEQMPIALLEAMASGLPAVCTDVGDVRAMLSAVNLPFVSRRGDDEAFTRALESLCDAVETRQALGSANRRRCEEDFSLEGMIDAYRRMYDEGLRGLATPAPAGAGA